MAKDLVHIPPQPRGARPAEQRWNGDFIDQVPEKRRLRQDFGVDERRGRLKRYDRQLVKPM
jgi:hypothetical protein